MLPEVFLREHQLRDFFGAPVILAAAKRARDGHRLVGDELVFDRRFTSGDGKSDELATTTIESHVHGTYLPPQSRHRPIEISNFYDVVHVALSRSIQIFRLPRDGVKCWKVNKREHRQRAS
jgi:hypothetical protein